MNQVAYSRKKIIQIARTLEEIVVSLDRIGSGAHAQTKEEYHSTLEAFFRRHDIMEKVVKARRIIADGFSTKLGPDDMDELERELQGIRFWTPRKIRKKRKPNKRTTDNSAASPLRV